MWESKTFEAIMDSMLDKINDDMDKREGSLIWDALAPAALELEQAYLFMEYTLNQAFGDTADREFLIRKAAERGLSPNEATPAIIKGVFVPSSVNVDGLRFNLGGVNFVVGDPVSGESGAYQLTCETAGTEGNVALGSLIPMDNVEGLESATATAFIELGADEEDTEVFRERYLNSFDVSPFGGNVTDYKNKILSIDGVGAVRITPVWNGTGTVKATILDSNYGIAYNALISLVQNTMDPDQDSEGYGVVPIGHVLTVDSPSAVAVHVKLHITEFESGYSWDTVKDEVRSVISDYIHELLVDWGNKTTNTSTVVRIAEIESRVLAIQGIVDLSSTMINNNYQNLTITGNSIPNLGAVTNG